MAYNIAYRKDDESEIESATPDIKNDGTPNDLKKTVTLLQRVGEPEKRTLQFCIDNGFGEVRPGVWAGSWHEDHPEHKEFEIPEALKRFIQQQMATPKKSGSFTSSDLTSGGVVSEDGMNVYDVDEPISLAEALNLLRQSKAVLEKANSQDEPWQHPKELLDATAGALDGAALATRADRAMDRGAVGFLTEIEHLSRDVKEGRKKLLYAASRGISNVSLLVDPVDKKDEPLVVWATQSGSSRKFALELVKNLHNGVEAVNMKSLTLGDVVRRKRVFFVCSTFGLGRPPRDAETFYATLQLQHSPGNDSKPLEGVAVAVAALGNSDFGDFAAFGRALSQELQGLGAMAMLPVFTVDAVNGKAGQKADFRKWQDLVLKLEGKEPIGNRGEGPALTQARHACCHIL